MIRRIKQNKNWLWLLIVSWLFLFTLPAQAAITDSLDYQGYLTDSGGSPIDVTVSVTFSFFNVGSGGIAVWSETQPVAVSKGLFTVKLGGAGNPFPLDLFDAPLWLGLDVASDGEMSPRIALGSVAFAHKADDALTLDGISATTLDQSAHVTNTGNPHSVTATQVGAIASAGFIAHTGDVSAHHARYSDGEATGAMGTTNNTNPLNHNRYANTEAVAAIKGADGAGSSLDADLLDGMNSSAFMPITTDYWVNIAGDTMTGVLNVNAVINTSTGYQIGGTAVLETPSDNVFVGDWAGAANTTGTRNTFSGYQAGFYNTTGRSNTFSGFWAGFSNTTGINNTFSGSWAGQANKTGSDNTFLGYAAGTANTTGSRNTFSGYQAGTANTTGSGNTFSGYTAGLRNTTGYSNTFSGYKAGVSNTTGSDNTFSGFLAGSANTTGYSNIFSGYAAGSANTTGNNNTFSGFQAGFKNTTGESNTFSGNGAGRANTTGVRNTFIGNETGQANTQGGANTFLGHWAGYENTTGIFNTFLGNEAGYSNSAGNRNVFLGYQAGYYETGSDRLYIDNSTTTTPLIWGNFLSNFLDVNGRLQVKRSINTVGDTLNHVAIIENTSTGTSADVLALKVGMTTAPGGASNFISFKDGSDASLGAIQGNGAGSVTLASAGADYAEYLPRMNKDEIIAAGDIVGIFNGKVSKQIQGADRTMVVSSNPIVTGNDPGEDKREAYRLIAFVGQAEVNVRGIVKAGDYLIPDGKQTGVGVAISADAITAEQFALVVGQAWETSTETKVKKIRALVGLQQANPVIMKLAGQVDTLTEINRVQSEELAQLRTELASVIQQVVHIQKIQQQQPLYSVRLAQ